MTISSYISHDSAKFVSHDNMYHILIDDTNRYQSYENTVSLISNMSNPVYMSMLNSCRVLRLHLYSHNMQSRQYINKNLTDWITVLFINTLKSMKLLKWENCEFDWFSVASIFISTRLHHSQQIPAHGNVQINVLTSN